MASKAREYLWLICASIFIMNFGQSQIASDQEFIFQDPKSCALSRNETFSNSKLACLKCLWTDATDTTTSAKILKLNGNGNDCPCPKQYYNSEDNNDKEQCTFCLNGTVTSNQGQRGCITCGDQNKFDNSTGECGLCPSGHIQVHHNLNGSLKEVSECIKCADGLTPSFSSTECIPCHSSFPVQANGICACPVVSHELMSGVCILKSIIQETPIPDSRNLYKIHFEKQTVESRFIQDNLKSSFYLCKGKHNETACQVLANICTLQLHSYFGDSTEINACQMYRAIEKLDIGLGTTVGGGAVRVPKLDVSDHIALLQKRTLIPYEYRTDFSQANSNLEIFVARHLTDGKFIGLIPLVDVIPCQEKAEVKGTSRKFGSTTKTGCYVPIKDLFSKYNGTNMEFLDAYLVHEEKGIRKMYSIPIKIQNLQRDGLRLNNLEERYQWQLVRRFFLIDTIGGYGVQEKVGEERVPKIVRYLESVNVGIQLQTNAEPGRIFIPMITLTYNEMDAWDFQKNELVEFTYSVEYFVDMARSIEDVKIAVGVISSLSVIVAAFQTWSWTRRNGSAEVDLGTMANLLLSSCGNLADAFFIVCFSTVLYWFVFFKKQMAVHVFLPKPDQELLIRDLLISACALKVVSIMKLIWRQVSVDIFFVDWERPKIQSVILPPSAHKGNNNGSAKRNDPKLEGSVSIWRTYFIANEWNEIQSTRKIHIASQIIITLFFLEVVGFKHWGLHWPEGTLKPGPEAQNVPYSTSARFAIGTLVFGIIGALQWIYRVGIYDRFVTNKIQDFVDICTMSNISVFILAAKQQGYYIHGRSVHGFADTDMQTMIEQLSREEEDLCGRRGLVSGTDQQTFLISVPTSFRMVYDQALQPLYISSSYSTVLRGRQFRAASKSSLTSKPSSNQLNLSIQAYHSMNRLLTSFLEHAVSDLDYEVCDKTFVEDTLDMEFKQTENDRAVFYNDNGHSFDSVLFYGNEKTLFLFDLYMFIFIDVLSQNYILAGTLTYVFALIFKCARNSLGRRNLARKTLIDSRFLI